MSELLDGSNNCTPPELLAVAKDATENLLPKKSTKRYLTTYNNFLDWRDQHNTTSFSENVILAYISYLKNTKKYKPTTLWATFSMLGKTIQSRHNYDISAHKKVIAFIKKENVGYKPKKSKILTQEEILKFIRCSR